MSTPAATLRRRQNRYRQSPVDRFLTFLPFMLFLVLLGYRLLFTSLLVNQQVRRIHIYSGPHTSTIRRFDVNDLLNTGSGR